MLSKSVAIATNTFREVIRQPVYGIIVFIAMLLVALSPAFSYRDGMEVEVLE